MFTTIASLKPVCHNTRTVTTSKQHLYRVKHNLRNRLDERLHLAYTHCREDRDSKICQILWEDVETCLDDLYEINLELENNHNNINAEPN